MLPASPVMADMVFPTPHHKTIIEHPTLQQSKIEVVFALDTTGSMSHLIHAAKEKIWSIASTMASAHSAPDIKMGLIAYRDRGDAYVTRSVGLSNDLDSVYAKLIDFKAGGGGDKPESVNQALYDAVNSMQWNPNPNTYKVIFLVGDAPAHMDYQDDVKYPKTIAMAKRKGIIINTIQAGDEYETKLHWDHIAHLGAGDYFQVEQTGNAVAFSTPYDKQLAELSNQLDNTRLYYGNKSEKQEQELKMKATDKISKEASAESLARRATFNVSKSGKKNLLGKGDLVEEISNGDIALKDIPVEKLPESIQAMDAEQQTALIAKTKQQRSEIESDIKKLATQREQYLKQKVAESGGKKDSLDDKIYQSIKSQAKDKGIIYSEDSARY
jgi:Mg-chelatase subunit ChlD